MRILGLSSLLLGFVFLVAATTQKAATAARRATSLAPTELMRLTIKYGEKISAFALIDRAGLQNLQLSTTDDETRSQQISPQNAQYIMGLAQGIPSGGAISANDHSCSRAMIRLEALDHNHRPLAVSACMTGSDPQTTHLTKLANLLSALF